jgi:hypothetical protein
MPETPDPAAVETVMRANWPANQHGQMCPIWRRGAKDLLACDCWVKPQAERIVAALDLNARDRAAEKRALTDLATRWQLGGWSAVSLPKTAADPFGLGTAQKVTDWLRKQADDA